jgi:hypothetical protein
MHSLRILPASESEYSNNASETLAPVAARYRKRTSSSGAKVTEPAENRGTPHLQPAMPVAIWNFYATPRGQITVCEEGYDPA